MLFIWSLSALEDGGSLSQLFFGTVCFTKTIFDWFLPVEKMQDDFDVFFSVIIETLIK